MKKFFKRGITSKTRDQIDGLLFVAVPIIGLTLFIGIPLVFSLVLSFGKLTTFEITDITFVGFENYVRRFFLQIYKVNNFNSGKTICINLKCLSFVHTSQLFFMAI